jgi:hypothetical protein
MLVEVFVGSAIALFDMRSPPAQIRNTLIPAKDYKE